MQFLPSEVIQTKILFPSKNVLKIPFIPTTYKYQVVIKSKKFLLSARKDTYLLYKYNYGTKWMP